MSRNEADLSRGKNQTGRIPLAKKEHTHKVEEIDVDEC